MVVTLSQCKRTGEPYWSLRFVTAFLPSKITNTFPLYLNFCFFSSFLYFDLRKDQRTDYVVRVSFLKTCDSTSIPFLTFIVLQCRHFPDSRSRVVPVLTQSSTRNVPRSFRLTKPKRSRLLSSLKVVFLFRYLYWSPGT